jgi:hypothetical protein
MHILLEVESKEKKSLVSLQLLQLFRTQAKHILYIMLTKTVENEYIIDSTCNILWVLHPFIWMIR